MIGTFIRQQSRRPALRVFLAEDNQDLRRALATALRRDGHFVVEAQNGPALMLDLWHVFEEGVSDATASLVLTDVEMPGRDGLDILRTMREQPWCPPFILMTAHGSPELYEEAKQLGARAVFDKPFDLDVLRATISSFGDSNDARA